VAKPPLAHTRQCLPNQPGADTGFLALMLGGRVFRFFTLNCCLHLSKPVMVLLMVPLHGRAFHPSGDTTLSAIGFTAGLVPV